jgi:predicted nucleic acid-binding Zn ribbon protein
MADDTRTVSSAHSRIDTVIVELREHQATCSAESKMQNARLKRVEAILIGTAGATILLLLSLVLK